MTKPGSDPSEAIGGPDLEATLACFFRDPRATALPPLESPFAERFLEPVPAEHPLRGLVLRFARDGFVTLDLEIEGFDEIARRITGDLAGRYTEGNRRVQEAWYFQQDVRALACRRQVLDLLAFLDQREPIPFQTLDFDVGTEQATHSDVLHFDSIQRRYMCGVWVALEEIDAANGPLHYYPGSHRLPDYDLDDLGLSRGFEDYARYEHFIAALARAHGLPCLREVIDLKSGRFATPRYHGATVDLSKFPRVDRYPRPLPPWVQ
jgi:hypothetical protein